MSFGDLKVQDLIYEDSSNNEITVVIADLATKANPTFTGTVTVPTATAGDNSTKAASTAFVVASFAPKAAPAFTGNATGVNLTLSGDLTVNGTTTTINTTTLQVEDKNIEIGKVSSPSDTTADGGGWTLLGSTNKTFNWLNATDSWTSSEHIEIASGKNLKVDGTTFFVDGTNNRVGIKTTSPTEVLDLGQGSQLNLKVGSRGFIGSGYSTNATILGHSVKADTTNTVAGQMMVTETNSGGGAPSAIRQESGIIQFHTASNGTANAVFNSERMRITSAGKLLLGTSTPQGNANADDFVVATSGHAGITIRSGASHAGNLFFADGVTGGAEYQGWITYNHSTQKLTLGSDSAEALEIDSSQNATFSGSVTATSFVGSGANLTNLPAGGNTFTAVANGSIANNKAVKIDDDGKVSEIKTATAAKANPALTSGLTTNGIYVTGTSEDPYDVKVADVGNDHILVAWVRDNWPSNGKVGGKAVIGQLDSSGHYAGFGSEFQWATNTGFDKWDVAYDSTNSTIIFSYTDDENSGKGYSRFCKYNASTNAISDISSGVVTRQWRNASDTRSIVTHWDNSIQRLILGYQAGNGQGGHSVVLAKNSSDDSYASTYAGDMCGSTNAGVIQSQEVCMTGLTSGKVVTFWNGEDGNFHYAIGVVNTSNNTIAWGTRVQAKGDEQFYPKCAYNADKNIVAFVGRHSGGSNHPYAHFAVFNNSNNTIGSWTGSQLAGTGSEGVGIAYCPDSVRFVIAYMIGSSPNHWDARAWVHGTADNASSFSTTNAFNFVGTSGGANFSRNGGLKAFAGKGLVIGGFNGISGRCTTNQISTTEDATNLTHARKFVGFADQAYTNGQTATIKTYGNNVSTLSGLTIGSVYYVQGDGTVGTSWDSTRFASLGFNSNTPKAGTAIAANTILIRDPEV